MLSISRPLLVILACIAALLASCSTVRLSYDHADWLLARMAARYVDLEEEQSRAFRAQLDSLHDWHRVQELPRYALSFDDAAARVERGLGPADMEWLMRTVRERSRALGEQAAPHLAPVVATLSESQVRQMEQRFAQDNRKFAKRQVAGDRAALTDKRSRWLSERLEEFVGALAPAQQARVDALVAQFPEMPKIRLEERSRRQQVLVRMVREGRGTPHLQAELSRFLANPDAGRAPANELAMRRWERAFADMLLDLDRSLSPAQRRAAVAKLRSYASDFRELSAPRAQTAALTD